MAAKNFVRLNEDELHGLHADEHGHDPSEPMVGDIAGFENKRLTKQEKEILTGYVPEPEDNDYAPPSKKEASYLEPQNEKTPDPEDEIGPSPKKRARAVEAVFVGRKKRKINDLSDTEKCWLEIISFLLDKFWMPRIHDDPAYAFKPVYECFAGHLENCKTVQNLCSVKPELSGVAAIVSERNIGNRVMFLGPALKYLTFTSCEGQEVTEAKVLYSVSLKRGKQGLESAMKTKEQLTWGAFYKGCKFPWKPNKRITTRRWRNRDIYFRQFEEDPSLDDYRKSDDPHIRVKYTPFEATDPSYTSKLLDVSLDEPLLKPLAATSTKSTKLVGYEPSAYEKYRDTVQLFTDRDLDELWPDDDEVELPTTRDFFSFCFPESPADDPKSEATGLQIQGEFAEHFDFKHRHFWLGSKTNTVLVGYQEVPAIQ